jgi:hypothetical protein
MFKKAIKKAMERQGRSGKWLSQKTGIPTRSIWQGLSENGYKMSMDRVEKCFIALNIKIIVPEN